MQFGVVIEPGFEWGFTVLIDYVKKTLLPVLRHCEFDTHPPLFPSEHSSMSRADLSVPAGVIEPYALHAGSPVPDRAGGAAESRTRVLTCRPRIARLDLNTLKNVKYNTECITSTVGPRFSGHHQKSQQ